MSASSRSKETILVITVGLLVLHLVFSARIFLTLSLIVGLTGILSTLLSEKIDFLWNKLSHLLGTVSNGVLLTLVFFLVLTPVGLVRRLFKKNGMTRAARDQRSNFTDRDHTFTKQDLEKTW